MSIARLYNVKPPNLTFYGGHEYATRNFPFSFWTWIKSLRIQLQEKTTAFDIDAIKFEKTQFHFLPTFICGRRRPCLRSLMKVKKQALSHFSLSTHAQHSRWGHAVDNGDENRINFVRQFLAFCFSLLVLLFFLKSPIGCISSHNDG